MASTSTETTPMLSKGNIDTTKTATTVSSSSLSSWDTRTRFVVYGQVVLFLLAWTVALGRNIHDRFWKPQYNQERHAWFVAQSASPPGMVHMVQQFFASYYTTRYVFFFPHIIGAIVWWNFYYFQLIPSIRRNYRKFHRILGRILLLCALCQTVSGVGLAYRGTSSTIKLISYLLALAVGYCVYQAYYYIAIRHDIAQHQYWALRLVGYVQTIALQRFYMGLLIVLHKVGYDGGLYTKYAEDEGAIMEKIFEDSFSCCFPTAILITEWYLAGYYHHDRPIPLDDNIDRAVSSTPPQKSTNNILVVGK